VDVDSVFNEEFTESKMLSLRNTHLQKVPRRQKQRTGSYLDTRLETDEDGGMNLERNRK